MKTILSRAKDIQNLIVKHRRKLHAIPEIGMNLPQTKAYVLKELGSMGYQAEELAGGLLATVGQASTNKTFLIRADMDALKIREESGLAFASTNGNCHACGHDTHTAMLLGAAKILKDIEDQIDGQIKIMFQAGEESLEGAKAMIDAGVLENPKVDAAMSLHIFSNLPIENGVLALGAPGPALAGSTIVNILVEGLGCHGAKPQEGIDTITVLARIHTALQTLIAREFSPQSTISLTFGSIHAGQAANVIPDKGYLSGTLRVYNKKDRDFARQRIIEISKAVALTYRAQAKVDFPFETEVTVNDESLTKAAEDYLKQIFDEDIFLANSSIFPLSGSEDFSFIADKVPAIFLALSAAKNKNGPNYPMHHPKVLFDESYLYRGTAAYVHIATQWLKNGRI